MPVPKPALEPKASPESMADDGSGLAIGTGTRLSAITTHGPPQAPTPTSPAGDSGLGEVAALAAPGVAHWSQAPSVSPVPGVAAMAPSTPWSQAPVVPGLTESCLACHGSGVVQPHTNMRLLRLHALATPPPAAPPLATPAPAERPGNGLK